MNKQGRATLVVLLLLALCGQAWPQARASRADLQAIRQYIKQGWHTLERTPAQLAKAAVDPKFARTHGPRWPVYVPRTEQLAQIAQALRAQMPAEDFAKIELLPLPADTSTIQAHGLLYLPPPYVVPGRRFNARDG